jgi:hypothetical protein
MILFCFFVLFLFFAFLLYFQRSFNVLFIYCSFCYFFSWTSIAAAVYIPLSAATVVVVVVVVLVVGGTWIRIQYPSTNQKPGKRTNQEAGYKNNTALYCS